MGFFGKIFSGGASLERLRKAVDQRNFAEARLLAEQLAEKSLEADASAELERLRVAAGDGLAHLNLEEALALQRSGAATQAAEHLQLALEQACSADLRRQIEKAAETAVEPEVLTEPEPASAKSCSSCGPQPTTTLAASDQELPDAESQLDLILTSYPEELAARYRQKCTLFLQAFLHAQAGDDETALSLWNRIDDSEQDELYWFEVGAAKARLGSVSEARLALEKALQLRPGFLFATEALIPVLIADGEIAQAEALLQEMLEKRLDPDFCHAQLTMICLQQDRPDEALEHTRKALAVGVSDPAFLMLAASLFEQIGALDDAERVLRQLPGGGCGGGLSLPLAEFWLRQHRELAKVLDAFNAACRQEPENPRWQLRVAQTYLARQWKKEGLALLQKVVADPRLDPELQQEAQQLVALHAG